ncbi:MAG TPA: adenylyltransferase/cytidyltransferase family protein [Candidatus Acidoferrum sp.]|jgi:rfaE bifunctional protein nucleotidyltransferase chain/domain|nr:adenylyltransferase/cytidyltransferase family protein [Candidatus Acidoferrum sp.]
MGKVIGADGLLAMRDTWQREGRRIVLASGAFDLLHPGHIRLLEQARSAGDILVVAVESDTQVRKSSTSGAKSGVARPATPASERTEIIASLTATDYAFELGNLLLEEWVAQFQPDILVQGGAGPALVEISKLEAADTSLLRIPLEPGYSTAALIERIQQLPQ